MSDPNLILADAHDLSAVPETKMFEQGKVCICLPWYRTADPRTTFSLLALLDRRKHLIALDFGDAFVAHARGKLADNFLKTSAEWMLTVDSDMVIPFSNPKLFRSFTGFNFLSDKWAGLNTVDRLISHGKTLVGALYFGRWPGGKAVYAEGSESAQEESFCRRGPHDLIKPTRWVGTGCMLVHRTVFTDIEKKFPNLARKADGTGGNWFTSSEHDVRSSVESALELDDPEEIKSVLKAGLNLSRRNSGLGMGEDVQFCIRAAQAGHQPFVDLGLMCGHVGDYSYGPKKTLS